MEDATDTNGLRRGEGGDSPYLAPIRVAGGKQIGQTDGKQTGSFSLDSKLPYTLDIKAGAVDKDEVGFAYAGTTWDSGTQGDINTVPRCNRGRQGSTNGYEGGNRKIDCWFTCGPPGA